MSARPAQRSPDGGTRKARQAFIDIEVGGKLHRIVLKRVATARRFTLRVRNAKGDVVLTLPPQGSSAAARAFALRNAGWIAEKLAAIKPGIAFAPGSVVPLRGDMCRLEHRPGLRRRVWVESGDPSVLCVSGPPGGIAETLTAFLRQEARRDLAAAADRHAALVGRTIRQLTLRDTRSRWGSCSGRGTLNFSWRLIFAPPFVLDYLAAHEVGHLVHMDHGSGFWALVRKLAPRTAEAERWLKQNGAALHLYGAVPNIGSEPWDSRADASRSTGAQAETGLPMRTVRQKSAIGGSSVRRNVR